MYLAIIELIKNKADCTLKTWIEPDSIRVDEMQELLDMLPVEYQPTVRKEDSSLILTELRLEDCPLKSLSPSVDTEENRGPTPPMTEYSQRITRESTRYDSHGRNPAALKHRA